MVGTGGQHGGEYLHSVLGLVKINDQGVHHFLLGLYLKMTALKRATPILKFFDTGAAL
jgi:hypothetical protein